MILEQFQEWARTAPASGRADGVRVLARALLQSDLGAVARDAVAVLTAFLDDPSPLVRTALAEGIAGAPHAPHHLVLALADDQPAIAAIVLARSPVLADAELIDCAAAAHPDVQAAIAGRVDLSAGVAAALAETGGSRALAALAGNRGASLTAPVLRRMAERHGDAAEVRKALLARGGLPADVQVSLVAAASRALAGMVSGRGWLNAERLERVLAESRDRATVAIAVGRPPEQAAALAAQLRGSGQLTVGLAFRIILSGGADLFGAVLAELTGERAGRVAALLRDCGSAAFASLYRDAGLPAELLPAFRAALRAAADLGEDDRHTLSLTAVERVISSCTVINQGGLDSLLVMLRRFEAEAARDEARTRGEALVASRRQAKEPLLLDAEASPAASRPRYTIDLAAIEAELFAA